MLFDHLFGVKPQEKSLKTFYGKGQKKMQDSNKKIYIVKVASLELNVPLVESDYSPGG